MRRYLPDQVKAGPNEVRLRPLAANLANFCLWRMLFLRLCRRQMFGRPSAGCLGLLVVLSLSGCDGGSDVQSPDQGIPVVNPDTSGSKSIQAFEAHVQARRAAGDTALIDHRRLKQALTDSIAGYTLELSESDRFASELFSFTEASKVFYTPNEDYIELTLGDYVNNPDFFRVNIQRYNLAQGVEISGVKDEKRTVQGLAPAQAQDFFTWSSYNSRQRRAWVFMGLDERYFLTLEATNQENFMDLNAVKGWVNWEKLTPPQRPK